MVGLTVVMEPINLTMLGIPGFTHKASYVPTYLTAMLHIYIWIIMT
jgi:hypothetical protein